MIVEQSDREFDGGNDVFSLSGRLALLGGGLYAADKTMSEQNIMPESVFSKRSSRSKRELADVFSRAARSGVERPDPYGGTGQSKYFNFAEDVKSDIKTLTSGNIDDLRPFMKGGYKGFSSSLGDELSVLLGRMDAANMNPLVRYKMTGDEISYIGIQAGDMNFRINPVLSSGEVITGSGQQNRYISRPVYQATGADKIVYGEDVGLVRALDNNLEKVISGELELNDFYEKYQTARNFDDKNFPTALRSDANPELIDYMKGSMIEDPGLKVDPLNNRGLSARHKQQFMVEQGKSFAGSSSASDINRGILLSNDNPLAMIPFLEETSNPKQVFRNVQHIDKFGNAGYRVDKNTLFLAEDEMDYLRDALKDRGMNIGELAEEQILARSDAGKIIDRQRSIAVSSKGVAEASEYLLDRVAGITGLSADQLSATLRETGISGFTEDQQRQIRSLTLGEYGQGLENQLESVKTQMRDYTALQQARGVPAEEIAAGTETYRRQIESLSEKLSRRDFFGMESDMMRESKIQKNLRDLNIDDIHFQNNKITFRLRREKALGPGDKIHESAGEVKAIIKGNVDNMAEVLADAYNRKTGLKATPEMMANFEKVDFVANSSAMRSSLESRNAASLFHNVFHKAHAENNTRLIHELETFKNNYNGIPENQRAQIFKRIEEITGMPVTQYANQNFGFGNMRTHFVAFGNAAADMGAGNIGTVSERHFYNFKSLGLNNFIEDVVGRRQDKSSILAALEFERADKILADPKFKTPLTAQGMTPGMIDEMFPRITDANVGDPLASRRAMFERFGIKGTGYIDLGQEIGGVSRLAVFSDDFFGGHIGPQVGSSSDVRRYGKVDKAVRDILYEIKKPNTTQEKLERLVKNYQVAMSKMGGSLREDLLKGKTLGSYYGIVNSAPEALSAYASRLGEYYGTKSAIPAVGLATKEKFIDMFGYDQYKAVHQQLKQFGAGKKYNLANISAGEIAVSDAWAMVTRDPTEGLTHIPMNVLPEDIFEGVKMDGSFSVITKPDEKGYHILQSMFGDVDGDSFQVVAATNAKSKEELFELAYGNTPKAIAFRESQRAKAEVSLKGRQKFEDGKRFFDIGIAERREAVARAKQLEKGMIGKISTALQTIHQASHNLISESSQLGDYKRFLTLANSLHYFAENSIKGKYQTFNELRGQKTLDILNHLTGAEGADLLPIETRKQKVMGFFDELVLGTGNEDIAEKLRAGAALDTDQLVRLQEAGIEDVKKVSGWFQNTASRANIDFMFEAYNQGVAMGSNVKGTMAADIMEIAAEGTESAAFQSKIRYERLTAMQENVKSIALKGAKNLGKYALLPAAAIGLAGTVFGGRSEIKTEGGREYSDGAKRHFGGNDYERRQVLSPQMRRPKYENIRIEGESSNSRMNYNNVPNNSRMRIEDHSSTLDKYEIQEIVERGL